MRFDFHKYKTYRECPRKFGFMMREVPATEPDNRYYSVHGQLVQKFFEMYANKHIPDSVPFSFHGIKRFMEPFFANLLQYNKVDWGHPMSKLNQAEFLDDVVTIIHSNLNSLNLYREGTRSELKIEVTLKGGDVLVSKIDFEKRLPTGGVVLIDGKATGTLGKNIDPGQLLFYAGMYQAQYKVLPEELWFVYYKLLVKESVKFDSADVRYQVQDVIGTLSSAKSDTTSKPTPCAKACKYCSWVSLCPEGKEDIASRRRGPRTKKDLVLSVNPDATDFLLM